MIYLLQIIPPSDYVPRRIGYDNVDLLIPTPIEQLVRGKLGVYQARNIERKAMRVKNFARLASSERYVVWFVVFFCLSLLCVFRSC